MEPQDNPYEILGVDDDADDEAVKKAFHKAALRYHPDRQQSDEDKQQAHTIFAKYSAAYDVLTDPVKRYDWKQARSSTASKVNDTPRTPGSVKKPAYCPQSAPARTSTTYSSKAPHSKKKAPPPPPPFGDVKRKAPENSPKMSSTSSSRRPAPSKNQAPPAPPFGEDEITEGSRPRLEKKEASSYRFKNKGRETFERSHRRINSCSAESLQGQPSGSYSFVPELFSSSKHLKEDMRPRAPSSRIFSDHQPSQSSSIHTSPHRSSPYRYSCSNPSLEANKNKKNESDAKRGRSQSPRRQASISRKGNQDKSYPHSRSQSPRERRPNVASSSPRSRRKTVATSRERGSLPPPTKAKSLWGVVSNSPKTKKFLHELTRDTRIDAEPYRRKKATDDPINNNSENDKSTKHPESGRRSKSLSLFRRSSSRTLAESKVDTEYSYTSGEKTNLNDSSRQLRRGRRPRQE